MQPFHFAISPEATIEIKNIKYYLKNILNATKASQDFEINLYKKIDLILKNPHMYKGEHIGNKIYRQAMVKRYIIAFYIDEPTRTVHITAIGHSLQRRKNTIKG